MKRMSGKLFPALLMVLLPNLALSQAIGQHQMSHGSGAHDHRSMPGDEKINVAVLLYDGALLLDYGIAAEMFLAADFMRSYYVYTVGREVDSNLSIVGNARADYTFAEAPKPDLLIVPGGPLWLQEGAHTETAEYLRNLNEHGTILYSVCTGSLLLAKAGLLDGRRATTNHAAAGMLSQLAPTVKVLPTANFVDDGNIVTAAGAGTAIETTLHLIQRLSGEEIAAELAQRYLDYPH